jgi:hypothetical protein
MALPAPHSAIVPGAPFGATPQVGCECPGKAFETLQCEGPNCEAGGGRKPAGKAEDEEGVARGLSEPSEGDKGRGGGKQGIGSSVELTGHEDAAVHSAGTCSWGTWGRKHN